MKIDWIIPTILLIVFFLVIYIFLFKGAGDISEQKVCVYKKMMGLNISYENNKILPDKCFVEYNGEFYDWKKATDMRTNDYLNDELSEGEVGE